MTLPVPPDLLAVTIDAVKAAPLVAAIVGTRVFDRIPATPTWPLLTVGIVDYGEAVDPSWVAGRVQFDAWGPGGTSLAWQVALELANAVVASSRDLVGTWPSGRIVAAGSPLVIPVREDRAHYAIDLYLEATS